MINQYDTLVDATKDLRERGFTASFEFGDGCLKETDTNKEYNAADVQIIEYHRFEGNTNPADMSVIYALEAKDGTQGTIIAPYGTYANPDLMELLDAIPIKSRKNKE
ncbi:MAG TPA: hypothetical protein VJ953_21905 [Saprospiraceae bacterium]|nr:hypothetical protein [Saprospiraceae bacterium]